MAGLSPQAPGEPIARLWIAATRPELDCAPLENPMPEEGPWLHLRAGSDAGLVTGCGPAMAAAGLSWFLARHAVGEVVGIGIAGAYPGSACLLGRAYRIDSDRFLDLGAEEGTGGAPLRLPFPGLDTRPFSLACPARFAHLPGATGATASLSTGTAATAFSRRDTGADLESMEGAAWALVASMFGIPFCQIRAVSNTAGPRDPSRWTISHALAALHASLATST